jgi:glycosyltransferase involved in cell wall biosynthesis
MKSVTLILPAHNEGPSIRETLKELDLILPKNIRVTVFVSEDGSRDNTREEVMAYSLQSKNIHVELSSPSERLGYSRAVLRGIAECKSDFVGFMDADGQCDPRDFTVLLESLRKGTIVVGYRNPRVDSKQRRVYSKLFGIFYRLIGGPKLIDPSSPFIVCNLDEIKDLSQTSPRLTFGFWWEFQMRIAARNLRVVELPVTHRDRSSGETQVYSLKRIPKIVVTHLIGLVLLRKEIKN